MREALAGLASSSTRRIAKDCSVPELGEHAALISRRTAQIGELAAKFDEDDSSETSNSKDYVSSLRAARRLRSGSVSKPVRTARSWSENFSAAHLATSGKNYQQAKPTVGFESVDVGSLVHEVLAAVTSQNPQFSVLTIQAEVAYQLRLMDLILAADQVQDIFSTATGIAVGECDSVLPVEDQETATLATKHLTYTATVRPL